MENGSRYQKYKKFYNKWKKANEEGRIVGADRSPPSYQFDKKNVTLTDNQVERLAWRETNAKTLEEHLGILSL